MKNPRKGNSLSDYEKYMKFDPVNKFEKAQGQMLILIN